MVAIVLKYRKYFIIILLLCIGARMTFGFSLYATFLLVTLVAYFRRDTQDVTSR